MAKSDYIKVKSGKSHCPDCKETVDLVQDIFVRKRLPMFYICWKCKKLWEVGYGEIIHVNDSTLQGNL